MQTPEILAKLNEIFKDILDNPDITINENTQAKDVPEWDSLNHIQIVVAIEKRFKVKFTTQEIQGWKNAGNICTSIMAKTQN
jgi:acyl carrier protein